MTATATAPAATKPHFYGETLRQWEQVRNHPRISGGFALDRNLWQGRRVAVHCITRGHAYRRTTGRYYYGTLDLTLGTADQFGIRHSDGEVSIVHKTRAVDVYDLTRTR